MKLFVKLIMVAVITALALPFLALGPGGGPLIRWQDFRLPALGTPELPLSSKQDGPASGNAQVCKWRDAGGQWHFSEQPPQGVEASCEEVDGNVNVFTAPPIIQATNEEGDLPPNKPVRLDVDTVLQTYSPENIEQLRQDAEQVKEVLNKRTEDAEKLLH